MTEAIAQPAPDSAKTHLHGEGTSIILALLENYYGVKDALVAEDDRAVRNAGAALQADLNQLDSFIMKSSSGYYNLWKPRDSVRYAVNLMLRMKDENFAGRRLLFRSLSSNMYILLQKSGLRNAQVYRLYDPAAFNDAGAYWLSNSPKIRNPYFGAKMLEWGEVVDTLR